MFETGGWTAPPLLGVMRGGRLSAGGLGAAQGRRPRFTDSIAYHSRLAAGAMN